MEEEADYRDRKQMKPGDTAYIVENREVKQVEVIKVTRDFVTFKYNTYLPDRYGRTFKSTGGLRLRRSKVFNTKEEAERFISITRRKNES